MKINKRLFRKSALTSMVAVMVLLTTSCVDLWKEQHPGTYYTNNGETVADYLNGKLENHGNFSYFKAILQEANLWGQMQTYGTYTVFAPDDSAIAKYIKERYDEAVEQHHSPEDIARFKDINSVLADRFDNPNQPTICDTIARTHIFNKTMYVADFNGDGILAEPNLLDKYISYFSDSITVPVLAEDNVTVLKDINGNDSVTQRLRYRINMQALIDGDGDDSVQNGVVHKITEVLRNSNKLICGVIKEDPELTLFYEALKMTHLEDTLEKYYIDLSYPGVSAEWTKQAAIDDDPDHHYHATSVEKHEREVMPEERKFLFTVFAVKDSVLKSEKYNINSWNDFVTYAKTVYPDATSEDPTSRASAINRLISYHILPYFLTYDQFNTCQDKIINNYQLVYTEKGKTSKSRAIDSEDFFTTLLPHSIMRISTPWKSVDNTPVRLGGIFINRKGIAGVKEVELEYEGTRIAETGEYKRDNKAENGIYHYVDGLLLYDETTKTDVLNCRMRIMACTLSPDFVNSGGRGRLRDEHDIVYCYYPDYCDNFDWVEGQTGLYVRYRDAGFGTFNGDELSIMYNYDISLKLPPVPHSGTYELRIWDNALSGAGAGQADRGVVQFFFHEGNPAVDDTTYWRNWYWEPEDIPVDLRLPGSDGHIGMVLDNSSEITNLTTREQALAIEANDRAMRNRMYMKAMDSYSGGGSILRNQVNCYRKIVWRRFMRDNTDYYLRMRQMYTAGTGVMPFSFIELVPKSVYEGNEDKH